MNEYKLKVDKYIGLLLQCEENEISTQLILDADLSFDIAVELQDELGKDFYTESDDEFEILLNENSILGIAVNVYEDGEVEYFLQKVINKDGITYGDDSSDIVFIQSDLIDCLELNCFNCDVVELRDSEDDDSEEPECDGDCENCTLHDEEEDTDDEDYEKEIEDEDTVEELFEELLSSIDELDIDENLVENIYELIKDKIDDAIEMGYEEGFDEGYKRSQRKY